LNTLIQRLADLQEIFHDLGVGWALVGGLAVTVRGEPRFTSDVDVVVMTSDDAEAEAVLRSLVRRGWHLHQLLEQPRLHRLATARMRTPPPDAVPVDLLFSTTGIESKVVAAATQEELGHLRLPVARVGHLVAMKLLSVGPGRSKDQVDLDMLAAHVDAGERSLAEDAISVIMELGTHRDKDLPAALLACLEVCRRA
jgi:predicted nucleotidyltransferase